MKVKGVYVGRYNEQTQACSLVKENSQQLRDDIEKMPLKLRTLNAKAGERNKLKTAYGPWFVTHSNGWAYAVCTAEDYPERHAYGLIDKIRGCAEKSANPCDGKFLKQLRKVVEENVSSYSDLTKVDKVHRAQAEVQLLQSDLQTGIKKLMANQENLSQLDDRAVQMKNFAREFEGKCTQLESITFWHKWKFILMIVLIVLGAVSLVAVCIMIKY